MYRKKNYEKYRLDLCEKNRDVEEIKFNFNNELCFAYILKINLCGHTGLCI